MMMNRKLFRWIPTLAVALAFVACENAGVPTQPQVGLDSSAPAFEVITTKLKKGFKSVEETEPEVGYVQAVIDKKGGSLQIGSHKLHIPSRAVKRPTVFTLIKPEAGKLAFSLHAERNGQDVGAAGFDRPVTLTISYRSAKGVDDPKGLAIGWVKENGDVEVLRSQVNRGQITVEANLDHFSDYTLLMP